MIPFMVKFQYSPCDVTISNYWITVMIPFMVTSNKKHKFLCAIFAINCFIML